MERKARYLCVSIRCSIIIIQFHDLNLCHICFRCICYRDLMLEICPRGESLRACSELAPSKVSKMVGELGVTSLRD